MFDSDNDCCTNEELLVNLFDTLPCIDDVPENHFINIFHPQFPSNEEGIVAFGGDMSTSRLLAAYASGVFPMPIEGILLWWSFFPRLIIFPEKAHFSKSLLQKINTKNYEVKIDTNFSCNFIMSKVVQRSNRLLKMFLTTIVMNLSNSNSKGNNFIEISFATLLSLFLNNKVSVEFYK